MSSVDIDSLSRRVSRHGRETQLRYVFYAWKKHNLSIRDRERLAVKLGNIARSKYLWEVLKAWYHVCFQPCPFGLQFVHVDRNVHASRIELFMEHFRAREQESMLRLCLLGWQVAMIQRVSRLAKQTEICAAMIEKREASTLSVHFYNWFRLLDDVRMGRAAKRIQEDTKKLAELRSVYEKEFSNSDRLIELYAGSVRESEKRSIMAMGFYHWYVRSNVVRNQRLQLLHPKENRPNNVPSILSFQEIILRPTDVSSSARSTPPLPDGDVKKEPAIQQGHKQKSKPAKPVVNEPVAENPKPAVSKPAPIPSPAVIPQSPKSDSPSSSGSSSGSSIDPSTIAVPSLFKVSLPFFMRMRSKVRDWAMHAREAVAKRHQMAAIEQAVEQTVSAWRPPGVPMEILNEMSLSEALKIFKQGATLKKRKGGVSKIGIRDTLGGLKDQTRFFVGQVESADKFLVYFKNVNEARNGAPPNGAFSLDHLKNAQFSWEMREFGAVTDKMNDNDTELKKVSHIPDKFFIALVIAIRHALASQTRRAATASYMNLPAAK